MDLVLQAEKQRLAALKRRLKDNRTLTAGQRAELTELLAKHEGGTSVSCPVQRDSAGPAAVVPGGHALAASSDAQLAEVYAVDVRTIRWWRNAPGWPGGLRGPYVLRGELPAWIRARMAPTHSTETVEINKSRLAYLRERQLSLETDRLVREGNLVSVEEARAQNGQLWAKFRGILVAAERKFPGLGELVNRDLDVLARDVATTPSAKKEQR